MPQIANIYGNPSNRAEQYNSSFLQGQVAMYEWLLKYYSTDVSKQDAALYRDLIDDVRRDISSIDRQIARLEEKQITGQQARLEKDEMNRNVAARVAYSADRADRRSEFSASEAARRGAMAGARGASRQRAESRLAPEANLQREVQNQYTASGGDVTAGFDALNSSIQSIRELPKDEVQTDAGYYQLYSSYVQAQAGALAADPAFAGESAENLTIAAQDMVSDMLPPQYQAAVDRHTGRIDAEMGRDTTPAGGVTPGQAAATGTGSVAAATGFPYSRMTEFGTPYAGEIQRLREQRELAEEELADLRGQYRGATRDRATDPILAARQAYTQAYRPGTLPAYERNRLLEQAALLGDEERQQLLEGFREYQKSRAQTPVRDALERADLFYFNRRLAPGLDPALRGSGAPRQPGDVVGGIGSPFEIRSPSPYGVAEGFEKFVGRQYSPEEIEGFGGEQAVADRAFEKGLVLTYNDRPDGRIYTLEPASVAREIEQAESRVETMTGSELGPAGAFVRAYNDPERLRYVRPSAPEAVEPAFSEEEIRDTREAAMGDLSLSERVLTREYEEGLRQYEALQERKRRLQEAKVEYAPQFLDTIVNAEAAMNRALEEMASSLGYLQEARQRGLEDTEVAAMFQRQYDSASRAFDEAVPLVGEANRLFDEMIRLEAPEDIKQREVDAEVAEVDRVRERPEFVAEAAPLGRIRDRATMARESRQIERGERPAPPSLEQRDTEIKGQSFVEALRLVRDDGGRGLDTLLGTPIGIEVADLYQANKAKGDQTLEQLLSYLAREFPSAQDQRTATQVIYGLNIRDTEADYLGRGEPSPYEPIQTPSLDTGSNGETPALPEIQDGE